MYKSWYTNEREPNYCTKCKKSLIPATLAAGYDAYTGEEAFKTFKACPEAVKTLLNTLHDVWEIIDETPPIIKMAYV